MKRKNWLVVLAMLLIFALAAVGCGEKDSAGNTPGGDDAETIRIGVNYELSGGVAAYGTTAKDAILLAFEEINAAGGFIPGI